MASRTAPGFPRGRLVRGRRHGAADAHERHEARHGGAEAHALDEADRRLRQGAVATGSMVRRLQVAGPDLDGLHYIRAFGNSDAIRAELEAPSTSLHRRLVHRLRGRRVADRARQAVTIVMQEDEPLERGFGQHAGAFFRGVLGERGVASSAVTRSTASRGDGRVGARRDEGRARARRAASSAASASRRT